MTNVSPKIPRSRGTLSFSVIGGEEVVTEILTGGQTFLWEKEGSNRWVGVQEKRVFLLSLIDSQRLAWECSSKDSQCASDSIERLFAVSTNFEELADRLPWRSDPLLAEAIRGFSGLRILRQDCGVTLLSFLLSPLKRIDQIREGLLNLSRRWGKSLGDEKFSPPDWSVLSSVSEAELRECGIGYRAKSIFGTAKALAERPEFFEEIEAQPTEDARSHLMALPGVGRKIADCVLLFGLGRLEAFPIDTWIHRFLVQHYGLTDYSEKQLQSFAAAHFGTASGFAQQFLFAHARKNLAPR